MSLLNKNAFAALEAKKVKKSSKSKSSSSKDSKKEKKPETSPQDAAELEKAIFANPVGISSWADDDDDDYVPVVSSASADAGWSKVSYSIQAALYGVPIHTQCH